MDLTGISKMARAYCAKNAVGGNLHIVLDDGNVDDSHLTWCEGYACAKDDDEGERLARALARLPWVYRRALYLADWHVPTPDFLEAARSEHDGRDEEVEEFTAGPSNLQEEIDRRGRLIEEQERELNRLWAELEEMRGELGSALYAANTAGHMSGG